MTNHLDLARKQLTGARHGIPTEEELRKLAHMASQEGGQEALRKRSEAERSLAGFEGQVIAHAAAHELGLIKQAQAQGLCWECKAQPVSRTSTYGCCHQCEDK